MRYIQTLGLLALLGGGGFRSIGVLGDLADWFGFGDLIPTSKHSPPLDPDCDY